MICANPNCELCAPKSTDTASPIVKATPSSAERFDPQQVAALFMRLDPRGQALAWNLMECAERLQGKRG